MGLVSGRLVVIAHLLDGRCAVPASAGFPGSFQVYPVAGSHQSINVRRVPRECTLHPVRRVPNRSASCKARGAAAAGAQGGAQFRRQRPNTTAAPSLRPVRTTRTAPDRAATVRVLLQPAEGGIDRREQQGQPALRGCVRTAPRHGAGGGPCDHPSRIICIEARNQANRRRRADQHGRHRPRGGRALARRCAAGHATRRHRSWAEPGRGFRLATIPTPPPPARHAWSCRCPMRSVVTAH